MRILVSGAGGKMGQEVCRAVLADSDLSLVAAVDPNPALQGKYIGAIIGGADVDVVVTPSLESAIHSGAPDVMIDFTHPGAVMGNIEVALGLGVDCVIGTTGIDSHLGQIEEWAKKAGRKVFIAANFTIGAVLMMHMARIASRFFPAAEVIEYHHDQKADAPSGTSVATALKMAAEGISSVEVGEETFPAARGARVNDVRVHSIRLPGYVAHQEVIFGSPGQTLAIRHDSIDRSAYMPGVIMAVKAIPSLGTFTVGLDKVMGLQEGATS